MSDVLLSTDGRILKLSVISNIYMTRDCTVYSVQCTAYSVYTVHCATMTYTGQGPVNRVICDNGHLE